MIHGGHPWRRQPSQLGLHWLPWGTRAHLESELGFLGVCLPEAPNSLSLEVPRESSATLLWEEKGNLERSQAIHSQGFSICGLSQLQVEYIQWGKIYILNIY